jgi:glucose-1-phosphate thymidylyltransferase
MIGILLAGGTGSRLYPLTKVTNKHLLPVCSKPMIYYPLYTLINARIRDIIVVTGKEHMGDVVDLLGSGEEHGVDFTYKVQDKPGGIAQAIGLCRDIVEEEMAVILGDNIFLGDIDLGTSKRCKLFLKEMDDPGRFGVAEVKGDKIKKIEEKPEFPRSNLAVTGLYIYNPEVFDCISHLKPSIRGEIEITDVNNWYIRNYSHEYDIVHGFWSDAGTFESLRLAQEELWKSL